MTQAFSLAESHFKAIPDENVSVIVPYEEGKMRIADLLSAKPKAIRSILSKLHPYTVSISQGACKCLENSMASYVPVMEKCLFCRRDIMIRIRESE